VKSKTHTGNFFEDFRVGQQIDHATPRTITEGDVAVYQGLFGPRFALHSAATFAAALGFERMPVDSILAFHIVFGRTVPDVSLNAIANLGYAGGCFGKPVFTGDTLSVKTRVTGLKENRSGKTGVVYVHSTGFNQDGERVMAFNRWVMVPKRRAEAPAPVTEVPELEDSVPMVDLVVPWPATGNYDCTAAGSEYLWDDYEIGERIDHVDGITVEESDHMTACRLFQNTARVHFNQHVERDAHFGRRIVYGGYLISVARSLTFNGLANAQSVVAINGGTHAAPTFAGDTVYAWSEILDKFVLDAHPDVGALRVRTVAAKDRKCHDFPYKTVAGKYEPEVVLDFDYTVLIPRGPVKSG
jgi:2-methylfumaryl-CoA hydratase